MEYAFRLDWQQWCQNPNNVETSLHIHAANFMKAGVIEFEALSKKES